MVWVLFVAVSSPIIITEVMSNVKGAEDPYGKRNEYVEIYNQSADTVDLTNYFIYDFDAKDEICSWDNETILIKYPDVRIHSARIYPYTYALILDRDYLIPDTINSQPYNFPDSTLILTTDDHTIGNGLTTNDPLIVFSDVDACTTSFGTPYVNDEFPDDPGDGISWERIDLNLPDSIYNWHPSIDSSGGTPGRENSTTNAFDLAVSEQSIIFMPAVLKTGENLNIEIRIKNQGLRPTNEYSLLIFDDYNRDSIINLEELLAEIPGEGVAAFDSVSLFYTYEHPSQGIHYLGFKIEFSHDKNLTNNLAIKTFQVFGEIGEMMLYPEIFSPNNDGKDDLLQIDYRLPVPNGELTITIFDTRGRKVCDICRNLAVTHDKGTYYWNGNGLRGKAPSGFYIVYLEYHYHDRTTKAKKTTVLAR